MEAGRKTISVVFSDLAGSTALQEALDAESVRRVMARFYEVMRATVLRHGGTVEKFIGDAVVAVFGTPTVREDDALRAVRCAAEMARGLEDLGGELEREWGVRLRMRTGVNTGELVVSSEGILVGDTMNTAARLEQAAPAGEVLVGETTWRLVRQQVALEEVAPLELKGKSAPVRAWRVVSTDPPVSRAGEASLEAPLIGRSAELRRLGAVFDDAVAARSCRLVSVIGSPGLGKSRLADEFANELADRATILRGHCEPTGEGNTFLPVAEVVREVAGIGEADPPDLVREKLGALVPEAEPDRARRIEAVAGVLGIGEPASAQETFWALRRGLEHLAQDRPLVLVMDDLHWAQPMLLDLVEHLVEWVADAPVLLLLLARPELREVREALASPGRRTGDVIELDPLNGAESRALLDGLLGTAELPVQLLGKMLDTTEGNPLFLGELVRMLVDERALVREDGAWVLAGGVDSVEVPPSISALLTARIERLRPDERNVVERAAVIGKQFYRGAVAELVAPPVRASLDGHLEALRRKEMVEPEGVYWIDEPVYRFHHALIRDAAYRLLLKEARAVLHERFAQWLEEKAGELVGEHEEVIAFHLEQAHAYRRELGPLDAGARTLGARACSLLISAGQRALAREDLAAAINLFGRALSCDPSRELEILWWLCEAVLSAGDAAEAAGLVARYGELAQGDPAARARAIVLEHHLGNLTGAADADAAVGSLADAARELHRLGERSGEAKAWHVLAGVQARLGRVGDVEMALDRALEAARSADDRRRVTAVLAAAPRAALWGPAPMVRASGRCLDVVRILRMTPGNRHVEAIALRCQAVLEAMRGRHGAAREILERVSATLEELGLSLELHETMVHAGWVELLAGDPATAAAHLRAAMERFRELGAEAGAAHAAALLARALVEQDGHGAEAQAQAQWAIEHGGHDLRTAMIAGAASSGALVRLGDLDGALEAARRAVALAEPTDALADKADASIALATALIAAGRDEQAREAAAAARSWYEAKGHLVGARRAAGLAGDPATGELGARTGAKPFEPRPGLGDRPAERVYAEFVELFARRDLDGLLELHAPDCQTIDRRSTVSAGVLQGRDGQRRFFESLLSGMPDMLIEVEEVLAADDRVAALRGVVRGHAAEGGGAMEVPFGNVVVAADGQLQTVELHDHDDVDALLTRFTALGGETGVLGPGDRAAAEHARRFATHDLDLILSQFHEDFVARDHRATVSADFRGLDVVRAGFEAMFAVTEHLRIDHDEVLASDGRVVAMRVAYRGRAVEGGGHGEVLAGHVTVFDDAGRLLSTDAYEYDDDASLLARYAELGGRLPALGDRPPERAVAEQVRRLSSRDVEAIIEQYRDDYVLRDHRSTVSEDVRGRAAVRAVFEAMLSVTDALRMDVDEVLACDDRVIARRVAYRGRSADGGGEMEVRAGYVSVIEDGLFVSTDEYEYDDTAGMLARFAELGGAACAALGDRPPERLVAELLQRIPRRDVDAIVELYDEDCVIRDHRALGAGDIRGAAAIRTLYEAILTTSYDLRLDVDEVLAVDDRVIVLRQRFHGHGFDGAGYGEVPHGLVAVVRDGRLVEIDQYAADDEEAMLARFAELRRAAGSGGVELPGWAARQLESYNAHDLDGFAAVHAPHYRLVDHRAVGWGTISGRDEVVEHAAVTLRAIPDARMEIEDVLARDDRVLASRIVYSGHGPYGGGDFELTLGCVSVADGERVVSTDVYEPEDRAAMIARYAELGGGAARLAESAAERVYAEFVRRYARRELEPLLELIAEDHVRIDHRPLGWEPVRGRAGDAELILSAWEGSTDIRIEVDEVLAASDRVLAVRIRWAGHSTDGGAFELPVGQVVLVQDGQIATIDQYASDDRQAMLDRFAELSGAGRPSPT